MRAKVQVTITTRTIASVKPTAGDSTMPEAVLSTPAQTMPGLPALAMPAPSRPPTSACELDDGMPPIQVTTFQTIAPMSAPNTTRGSMTLASTMPLPMVSATWRPKNRKAMKLKNAAHSTA